MISVTRELGLAWMDQYIQNERSATSRNRVRASLFQYQAAYELYRPGRSFVETLDRTDFIRRWLRANNYSQEWLRGWCVSVRGFSRWLFESHRTDDDVMFYVSREQIFSQTLPSWRLSRNLQRTIARFEQSFPGRREKYVIPDHRWNLHRNRPECEKWTLPEAEEECWLTWLADLARGPESLVWKRDLVRGLARFFDFLVLAGTLETNLFSSFLRHQPYRLDFLRSFSTPAPSLSDKVGKKKLSEPRGQLQLPCWMMAYLEYLENRGRRAGIGSHSLSNLRVLNRVLECQGIKNPEEIGAGTIQAYLNAQESVPAGASKGSTQRLRLVTLRGLCRFLTRRGIQAPLTLVESWPRIRRPLFRPHIYT